MGGARAEERVTSASASASVGREGGGRDHAGRVGRQTLLLPRPHPRHAEQEPAAGG